MATLFDGSLPNENLSEIEYGAPAVPETFNAVYAEVNENLRHLATGQLIIVETRSDLGAHPARTPGAAALAFVLDARSLFAYDPRTPEAGEAGRPGPGDADAEEIGEHTVPSNDGKRWVRVNWERKLFYAQSGTAVDTDVITPTKDLGTSVPVVSDGVLPLEVRLSMDFEGKEGYTGAVELVEDGAVVATREVAEGERWVEMTTVRFPPAGVHVYSARLTHGKSLGAHPRLLTVRRG